MSAKQRKPKRPPRQVSVRAETYAALKALGKPVGTTLDEIITAYLDAQEASCS